MFASGWAQGDDQLSRWFDMYTATGTAVLRKVRINQKPREGSPERIIHIYVITEKVLTKKKEVITTLIERFRFASPESIEPATSTEHFPHWPNVQRSSGT